MITITTIQSNKVTSEVCTKMVDLCYKRAKSERVGRSDIGLDRSIEKSLLYVYAIGNWEIPGKFYIEGTETNCITQGMLNGIFTASNNL